MDYKYIEQLLERYWACETTLQEEQILRTFFQQEDVPAHLMAYKAVFDVQQEQAEPTLGEDFDAKMMELLSGLWGSGERGCLASFLASLLSGCRIGGFDSDHRNGCSAKF